MKGQTKKKLNETTTTTLEHTEGVYSSVRYKFSSSVGMTVDIPFTLTGENWKIKI